VLLLMALAGGAGWVLSDRSARQAETERAVNAALDEAASWQRQRRLPEALSAVRRADGLVRGGTADEALRRRVQARLADLELLEVLDNARLEGAAVKDEHFDSKRADELYGKAFRAAGLEVEGLPAEEAAEQLRRTSVAAELAAALDDWAVKRRVFRTPDDRGWQHLLAVARAVEPEGPAARVRDALRSMERQALVDVAASEETCDLSPRTLAALANALHHLVGAPESAKALLWAAQRRHPDDFWSNEELGILAHHSQPPLLGESIRYLTAAVSLRPNSPGAHLNLGTALLGKGDPEGAIAEYREALRLKPNYIVAHGNLGVALRKKGDVNGAIAEFRQVIALDPKYAPAHCTLGNALLDKGDLDGAIEEYRKAIALAPEGDWARYKLRFALEHSLEHSKGDREGAFREFQAAIQIDPKFALAHNAMSGVLHDRGDLEGAIRDWQLATYHYNLGMALNEKRHAEGAIREYQAAIQSNPAFAQAHCDLGHALLEQGRFAQALTALRRGHELGSQNPRWPFPSAWWVRRAELFVALEGKLPKLLKGEAQPADAAEQLVLAYWVQCKGLNAAATRFCAQAFAARPELADDLGTWERYGAACAAARAGCGWGRDAGSLDEQERVRLRRQALDWLRADLALRAKQAAGSRPADRAVAEKVLEHWLKNTAFAGVRGDALAQLPEAEREGWRQLWAEVADAVARAQAAEKKPVPK
jgi:serine/threonine-protein kinase